MIIQQHQVSELIIYRVINVYIFAKYFQTLGNDSLSQRKEKERKKENGNNTELNKDISRL